jgi:hypothetical protein
MQPSPKDYQDFAFGLLPQMPTAKHLQRLMLQMD